MWNYAETGRLLTLQSIGAANCIYCKTVMVNLPSHQFQLETRRLLAQLSFCPVCGWWHVYRVHQGHYPRTPTIEAYDGAIGCLKELDLTDISTPLNEVRQYLLAKGDSVFQMHPRIFEEVVCSVFKDCGWQARVTAYSGDNGIDVVLDGESGSTIGVQVKRYHKEHRIEAEQIRSLAGALLLNGHTKGIFITTSSFRRGAINTAQTYSEIGLPIELVDAERFLQALGIAQRQSFELDDERFTSYVLSRGAHLGSGILKEFEPGENLIERPVLARAMLGEEFVDLYADANK